jgi:hypothetical protein
MYNNITVQNQDWSYKLSISKSEAYRYWTGAINLQSDDLIESSSERSKATGMIPASLEKTRADFRDD